MYKKKATEKLKETFRIRNNMVMLKPKRFSTFCLGAGSPGQDLKKPNSLALTPKTVVKSQSEPKRSGFDWQTYNR